MTIYRLWNFGFGDHWASMSLLAHMGTLRAVPQQVSCMQHGHNFRKRLEEINSVWNWQCLPKIVDQEPDTDLDGFDVWACPPVPTTVSWSHLAFRMPIQYAVYQFDGVSTPGKNPSAEDQQRILQHLRDQGLHVTQLGKHMSVDECVRACAGAVLFVGSCSGMSHLAHSVGVPVYLLEYELPVITCHRQKQFVICKGAEHFIGESRAYLSLWSKMRRSRTRT